MPLEKKLIDVKQKSNAEFEMKFDSLIRGSFEQCYFISGKPKVDQTNFVYSRRFNVTGGNYCCKRIC